MSFDLDWKVNWIRTNNQQMSYIWDGMSAGAAQEEESEEL